MSDYEHSSGDVDDYETIQALKSELAQVRKKLAEAVAQKDEEIAELKKAEEVHSTMYGEKEDERLALVEALRAVYALAGEDKQVAKIMESYLDKTYFRNLSIALGAYQ